MSMRRVAKDPVVSRCRICTLDVNKDRLIHLSARRAGSRCTLPASSSLQLVRANAVASMPMPPQQVGVRPQRTLENMSDAMHARQQ